MNLKKMKKVKDGLNDNPKECFRMLDKETLEQMVAEIYEWSMESVGYLSSSTPYASGYKDGILTSKDIVEDIVKKYC